MIAAPLTNFTKNTQLWNIQWSAECDQAFQTLKEWLAWQPVLIHPDFSKGFILQTNASEVGLGAMQLQEREGKEHSVLYLSQKLSPREVKYSTIKKEALAVK